MKPNDFISEYVLFRGETEVPLFYHRWCAIAAVGALLGRNVSIRHGPFTHFPNFYVMLMGEPGARKSTAIKLVRETLSTIGYTSFSANKTSKEKFLLDLSEQSVNGSAYDIFLDSNSWGDGLPNAEIAIFADEFNNFIGNGNLEFISLLGELWDYYGLYETRIKHGKVVKIKNPTVSILGGNTIENLIMGFPPETLGQGFFSRLILVQGERTGKKIAFPEPPTAAQEAFITTFLQEIKTKCIGTITISPTAKLLLDKIYHSWRDIDDIRFQKYSNRRFTHLLKLSLITAASRVSLVIEEEDVIYANTILTYTELFMPAALGEFGKGKNSNTAHRILDYCKSLKGAFSIQDVWKQFYRDFTRTEEVSEVLRGLLFAGKLQTTEQGLLPKEEIKENIYTDLVNYSFLSTEEQKKLPW